MIQKRFRNPASRREKIQRQLLQSGTISVHELVNNLGVSAATIRRDLTLLDHEGTIQRTHGGAVASPARGADQKFYLREQIDIDAKRLIASAAYQSIIPEQTIFMNDGSTIMALARELLASKHKLVIATPGVNIATTLSENTLITVYLAGGIVRHRTLGTSGNFANQMLKAINADIAFLSPDGFSAQNGVTFSYEADSVLAKTMHHNASKTIVLATSQKLNTRDRITAIEAEKIDVLITDCTNEKLIKELELLDISIIICSNSIIPTQN